MPELVLVEVLLLVELEVDVLDEVEELVEVEVLEVMFPEVEVLVETLPEVDVELPPVEVEVDEPPVEVEVELPLTFTVTPLLLPVLVVVELIETEPPLEPPKKPPKNPPPKPPKPLDPPITIGVPPPLATIGAGAGSGNGTGAIANCCASMQTCSPLRVTSCLGASHSSVTMRLIFLTLRGTVRCTVLTYFTGLVVLVCLTVFSYLVSAAGASATCTAPPTASAPPAATADSFARAIRTDMVCSLSFDGIRLTAPKWPARLHPFTPRTGQIGPAAIELTMIGRAGGYFFGPIPRLGAGLSHSGTEPAAIPKRLLIF